MKRLSNFKYSTNNKSIALCNDSLWTSNGDEENEPLFQSISTTACFSTLRSDLAKQEVEKVFNVKKGWKDKRRKHMLDYDMITTLENYFYADPKWTSSTV